MATPQRKTRARKQLIERRAFIATTAILFLGIAVVLWIFYGQSANSSWSNIFSIIFVFAGVLIGLFQWLFPVNSATTEPSQPAPLLSAASLPTQLAALAPVVSPSPQTVPEEKVVYRGIMGLPPPTDPRTIQQREKAVRDIYARLTQAHTSAVVLTGIGGVGKSTLAALTYRYAEEQRQLGQGPFTDPAIWLNIDSAVTMADLAGNLCEIFEKPLPDFSNLSLQHQALALFNILNTPDECRLLVLDQFEDLLDGQTGHALPDRPGVGEWLDALNSQPCRSRLLMTTRPWPLGTREHPPTCMQEYTVRRLEQNEGVELLRKCGIEGGEGALRVVVERCDGHAFALTLLASLLRSRKLTLEAFLAEKSYAQVWTGNVARNLLDKIYTSQLTDIQRKVLRGFSIYREPVPLPAALALCDFNASVSLVQIQQALDGLLAQHLLQATGGGSYQLHAIIEGYARDNFVVGDDQANERAVWAAHAGAAQYYIRRAQEELAASSGQRRSLSDYDALVEAAWQYCQAHQWREAYYLIQKERLFSELKALGGLAILLELYKQLLPLSKWQTAQETPREGARIYNYLGSIYRSLGRRELAMQHLEQALKLAKAAGDAREEAWSLNHMGRLYASMGEKERARSYYTEVVERAQANQDRVLYAASLNNLGWIYSAWGKRELERKYYQDALTIYQELGDRTGEATTLNNLGRVSEDSGDYEQAQTYYRQALEIFQASGNLRGCGWTLNNLGRSTYFLADDKARAREYLEQALAIRREVDRRGEGRTLNNLGAVATRDGDYAQAWAYCLEALEISEEVADQEGHGKILRNLGQICLAQKCYSAALAFFLRARTLLDEVQSPGREKLQEGIDRVHRELGDEAFFDLLNNVEARTEILIQQYLKEPPERDA